MTDEQDKSGHGRDDGYDQAVIREWARKRWLRETMRTDALPAHELQTLDERLARWVADQQLAGKLPPDWQLSAQQPALEREFRQGRDEARPFFTPEEQRVVDASRAAAALRDRIDSRDDYGPALSQLATQYMVANGIGELDARKGITERFAALYGRTVIEYGQEQRRSKGPEQDRDRPERLFPAELGWDRYERAARRLAAHDAMLFVARRDGTLTNHEYHQHKKHRDRWMAEQQEQGRMPTLAEIRKSRTPLNELLLPYQKRIGRQETQRSLGEEGAYWRKTDELAGYLKQEIDEMKRYARVLDDYAVSAAAAYGKGVDRVKRDIEERFTLQYLDTPAEYLEARLERERQDSTPVPQEREHGDSDSGRADMPARPPGRPSDDGRER